MPEIATDCPICDGVVVAQITDDIPEVMFPVAVSQALDIHIEDAHPPEDLELIRIGVNTGYAEHVGQCEHDGERMAIVGLEVVVVGHNFRFEMDYEDLLVMAAQIAEAIEGCQGMARDLGVRLSHEH